MIDYEKLGLFYLGREYDAVARQRKEDLVLYDSRDLVTHAVCVGMTGSGKTGLCLSLLEEAAIDGVPAVVIDPKGDLGNLLLTFPDLSAASLRPWVNEDDARRKGVDVDTFAAAEAERWARGLAEWNQDAGRIRRLRDAADMLVYTPGSQAGIPVSVLRSFAAPPPELLEDADLVRERVGTTVSSLLGLLGIQADPIRSREHILLSTLLDQAWRAGQDLDIPALIQRIQAPPVARVGVLELEAFYPSADRFELAMALNNLLAAPGFSAWMEGEPLEMKRLLYTATGRPRVAIFSIAHLNDAERMFFVSLLLNQVLGWMRTQPGTTSLRAIVYMDEIFGYLPPTANPPSKLAMLTLLKQARAFGVGMVLATQNPVDLDYKALSNAGTWFIGRLQTERDQARVLDALEGVSSGRAPGFDRQAIGPTLAALGNRVFLLHNVHDAGPRVFETRWALSYLRGPLTRSQIKMLMDPRRAEFSAPEPAPRADRSGPRTGERPAAIAPLATGESQGVAGRRQAVPVLPPEIPQYYAPGSDGAHLVPVLVGAAQVRFTDSKTRVDESRTVTMLTPVTADPVPVDWTHAEEASFTTADLVAEPPGASSYAELPPAAQRARSYVEWTKAFSTWLTQTQVLELYRSPSLKLISHAGEAEPDFRIRLHEAAREARDARVAKLRQTYAPKVAALQERLRRAEQSVAREQEQASDSRVQTAISFGATLLGAVLGRKAVTASTVGKATTAARGVGRSMKESGDVTRAQQTVEALRGQLQELEAGLEADAAGIEASYHPAAEPLETLTIKPRRTGVQVQLVALTWMPR